MIVVDGHSSDDTVQKTKTFPVIILNENIGGRAGACQVGLENASGDFVAFTDADCIPSKNWLEMLVSTSRITLSALVEELKTLEMNSGRNPSIFHSVRSSAALDHCRANSSKTDSL